MIYALIVFIILQIADVWLTLKVIDRGGRELNPAVAWVMARLGDLPGLLAVKTVYVCAVCLALPWLSAAALWVICAAYAALAAWNALQLRK